MFDIDKLFFARYSFNRNGSKIKFLDDSNSTKEQRISKLAKEFTKQDVLDLRKSIDNSIEDEFDAITSGIRFIRSSDDIKKSFKDNSIDSFSDTNLYSQNTKEALQNRLIDMYLAVITDPDSYDESRLPLDNPTEILKDEVLSIADSGKVKGNEHTALGYLAPKYQSRKKYEYSTGKAGVGPSALNNSHHVLGQTAGLYMNPDLCAMDAFGIYDMGKIKGEDGIRILDWLNAMISAHVDVAKDPYILRLNVNPVTYNHLYFLLRAGKGKSSFLFLAQDSLKAYANEVIMKNTKYGSDSDSNLNQIKKAAYKKIWAEMMSEAVKAASGNKNLLYRLSSLEKVSSNPKQFIGSKEEDLRLQNSVSEMKDHIDNGIFDKDYLIAQMKRSKSGFDYYYEQLRMLKSYDVLDPFAASMADLVTKSQVDTKKYGISFTSLNLFAKGMEEIKESILFENIDNFFENTFLPNKLENALAVANPISEAMLLRGTQFVQNIVTALHKSLGFIKTPNEDIYNKISDHVVQSIKSQFFYQKQLEMRPDLDVNGMFFGKNTMSRRLWNIKKSIKLDPAYAHLADNAFINALMYGIGTTKNDPDIISLDKEAFDKNTAAKMKNYWSELLSNGNDVATAESTPTELADIELNRFAKDFIFYQFYVSGDRVGKNYVKMGEDDRTDLKFDEFIDKVFSNPTEYVKSSLNNMLLDLVMNKWSDNSLVPLVSSTYESSNSKDNPLADNKVQKINIRSNRGNVVVFVDERAEPVNRDYKKPIYKRFVKASFEDKIGQGKRLHLYELIGLTNGKKPKPIYAISDKRGVKGDGGNVYEFMKSESMIEKNNLRSEFDRIKYFENPTAYIRELYDDFNKVTPTSKYGSNNLKNINDWLGSPQNYMFDQYEIEDESDYANIEEEQVNILQNAVDDHLNGILDEAERSGIVPDLNIDNLIERLRIMSNNTEDIDSAVDYYVDGLLDAFSGDLRHFLDAVGTTSPQGNLTSTEGLKMRHIDYLNGLIRDYGSVAEEITTPITEIDDAETINIYAGSGENADLSNFAIRPFTINVELSSGPKKFTFQSVEQGFHFHKAVIAENPIVAKRILETTSGAELRNLTSSKSLQMTQKQIKEWDDASKSIMLNLMYDSYIQNPKESQKLLSTGNAIITHTQDNTRWKNDFPEVVMTVREMLREENSKNDEQHEAKLDIDEKISNKLGILNAQLSLYEEGSEQYKIIQDDINKVETELTELRKFTDTSRSQSDMDRINEINKQKGNRPMTTEEFNSLSEEEWNNLKTCN